MLNKKSREPRKNKKTKPSAIKRKEQRTDKELQRREISRKGNIK